MSESPLGEADGSLHHNVKYPLLQDREWLHNKYVVEERSGGEIADIVGCTNGNVYRALNDFEIDRRENTPRYQYRELHNGEWLHEQYVEKQKTAPEIAKDVGCNVQHVYSVLNKYDIETRPGGGIPNQLEDGLSQYAKELIEGELLGDGCLQRRNEGSESASYTHGTSRREYRDWLATELEKIGFYVNTREFDNNGHMAYCLNTRNYLCLGELYDRWYPKGKKIVPKGYLLSPIALRQWFIGDGAVPTHDNWARIRLHTEGFDPESLQRLQKSLSWVGVKTTARDSGFLYIPSRYTGRFYDYMAELPNELDGVYGYKW